MSGRNSVHAQALQDRLKPAVEAAGYEIVVLEYSKKGNTLRLLIDHLEGHVPASEAACGSGQRLVADGVRLSARPAYLPSGADASADASIDALPTSKSQGGSPQAEAGAAAHAEALAREQAEAKQAIAAAGLSASARSGIRLTDCQTVSRLVEDILDAEGLMPQDAEYHLEVSSPGVERPLTRPRDYARFVGHPVRVKLRAPLSGETIRMLDGQLTEANETGVTVEVGPKRWPISFDAIERARLRLP